MEGILGAELTNATGNLIWKHGKVEIEDRNGWEERGRFFFSFSFFRSSLRRNLKYVENGEKKEADEGGAGEYISLWRGLNG